MTYSFIKANGRVAILKDGEFDHQQFRSHYAYRNPEAYIAQLIERDAEAAADDATRRATRRAEAAERLATRAVRPTQLAFL